ncbi:hypothetical protein NMY22_g6592 [Coprinellus aureogranulatus]|nr:hypothetical protein NMY22_g6592 [Coprinellus aureogranulatus]
MSSDEDQGTGVLGVATGGIQDVSALLPLLGTEQCESLVTSALQKGSLYAAAAPMSIFGSLGIVKAGFVVLWGSINHWVFRGPKLLRNAGFTPTGVGELLIDAAEGDCARSVAEEKLLRHLFKKRIISVEINPYSADFWLWNIRLLFGTFFLSALGLLPYVYLIARYLSDDPFRKTWLYPVMRVLGCAIVAVAIQFIIQLRILEEAYSRIRFLATDYYLKDQSRSLPAFWDSNKRSKHVLDNFRRWGRDGTQAALSLWGDEAQCLEGLGRLTSFVFPLHGEGFPTSPESVSVSKHGSQSKPLQPVDLVAAEEGMVSEHNSPNAPFPIVTMLGNIFGPILNTSLMWSIQCSLLFGVGLAVVGYIGCFSVVQASPKGSSKGPLIWLVCEALLAVIRTLLWAWNPPSDDPKSPIALEKIVIAKDQETMVQSQGRARMA